MNLEELKDALRERHYARIKVSEAQEAVREAKAELGLARDAEAKAHALVEEIEREHLTGREGLLPFGVQASPSLEMSR